MAGTQLNQKISLLSRPANDRSAKVIGVKKVAPQFLRAQHQLVLDTLHAHSQLTLDYPQVMEAHIWLTGLCYMTVLTIVLLQ